MKIVTLVKAVPEVMNVRLALKGNDIDRSELNYAINEQDDYALEEALQLKEKNGGEVVVLSMGDEAGRKGITQVIRQCYAKGADRGIMLLDTSYSEWDDAVKARIASKIISTEKPDLVVGGSQSFDMASSRFGPMVAELIGMPHATLITALHTVDGGKIRVHRDLEQGIQEIVELPLPCLVTTQTGINTPRYASLNRIIAATRKEISAPKLQDMQITPQQMSEWNRVKISSVAFPSEKGSGATFLEGNPEEEAAQLVKLLREKGLIQR